VKLADRFMVELLGDDCIRISGAAVAELRAVSSNLRNSEDWLAVVDGIEDCVVQFDPVKYLPDEALGLLSGLTEDMLVAGSEELEEPLDLAVSFSQADALDLKDISAALSLSEDEIIQRLVSAELRVDMMGFTPGFAYMSGLDDSMSVPRLKTPRQNVPAGSLGIAGGKCGTYALAGPGGWSIVGRVVSPLFDPERENPFLLKNGQRVRLKRVDVR
tara:strand:- start:155667 stop:156314 length:648 start_codon:yes stop_codon:yes gene_type:complete